MMENTLTLVVILMGPALLALVLFAEAAPAVGRALQALFESHHRVEWLKEVVLHTAYYGGVVAAMLGVKQGTWWTVVFVASWFVFGLLLSFLLTVRLEQLARRDR